MSKEVKLVKIDVLKQSKHNPPSRIKSGIKELAKSIERVGLLDPIKISNNNFILDGHRRVTAYKLLKLEEIECIILVGNEAEIYAELNSQNKKLTGNETLQIYLINPEAISLKHRLRLNMAVEDFGLPMINRLAEGGMSFRAVSLARSICRHNGKETPENYKKALTWLLHFGAFGVAAKALQNQTPPSKIWAAIERHKPLKVSFEIGK